MIYIIMKKKEEDESGYHQFIRKNIRHEAT